MKVKIIKEEKVFDHIFKIVSAELQHELYNGQMSEPVVRLNLDRGDAVAAVIFDMDRREAVFVRQFRYPVYSKQPSAAWLTEVIAGMAEEQETHEQAITREVMEELGYTISAPEKIASFFVSPGATSGRVILFYVEVTGHMKTGTGGGATGEGEDIQAVTYSLPALRAALDAGEFMDAKTVIGCNYLLRKFDC
ncbi:MAG: NUDIX hydrolase [Taibaiella sp.]|nr:NUDIX hydrolase [Taibaiella sp.]